MHREHTRRERQAEIINKAIKRGDKKVSLRLYTSEARWWRDSYSLSVEPSPDNIPKNERKNEQTYFFDISALKDMIY